MRGARKHWRPPLDWPSIVPLLGTMSDGELARRLNVSHTSIHSMRRALEIRPHGLTDALLADLGTDDDGTIAKKHGVHWAFVSRARRKLGIAKSAPRHGTKPKYRTGCRCEPCRAANASYLRDYRERAPEVFRAIEARRRERRKAATPAPADGSWMFDS